MSSILNMFNSYSEESMNHLNFHTIQMAQHSQTVRSTFISSDQPNHRNLFAPSPSFSRYQNSQVSSSSFGFTNSYATYQMRRNIAYGLGMPCTARISNDASYSPTEDNPQLSQITFNQTITKRYSAIVPTNSIPFVQNDVERVKRAMDFTSNIRNPTFHPPNVVDKPHEILCPTPVNDFYPHHNKQHEILSPTPLKVVYPHQDYVYRRHLDMFSLPSKQNHDQHVPEDGPSLKRSLEPTRFLEETHDYFDSGEDEGNGEDGYDGRMHSLPYEKYGPYTCPKCNGVFDTSQKFAAHITNHYKSESKMARDKRLRARNKNKYRKLNQHVNGEP